MAWCPMTTAAARPRGPSRAGYRAPGTVAVVVGSTRGDSGEPARRSRLLRRMNTLLSPLGSTSRGRLRFAAPPSRKAQLITAQPDALSRDEDWQSGGGERGQPAGARGRGPGDLAEDVEVHSGSLLAVVGAGDLASEVGVLR